VEVYYNSNQFSHTLAVLVRDFESPFMMFEALADYYREGGYFVSTPSRIYRYEVLLGFACKVSQREDCLELYRELLTFDMYLRENLKNRPGFLSESGVSKEQFRKALNGRLLRMTHVERFEYAVWHGDGDLCGVRLDKPAYVLFDYGERNVLSHDAGVHLIEL
jgi:hypothetical protein